MSESAEELEVTVNPDPVESVLSTGQMLAAARMEYGLSVEDVAIRLRLGVRQIRALEEDDASALPDAMFVRGFIRNYAKLIGRDAEPFLEAYRGPKPAADNQVISLRSANIPIIKGGKKLWLPYAIASGMIAVGLGLWTIYMDYMPHDKPAAVAEKSIVAKPAPVVAPEPEAPVPPPVLATELSAKEVPAPVPAAASAPAPVTAKLSISFAEHSWVSVTDHDGHEIFNKNQAAGTQADVEGQPPFNIVVGNVSGVRLSFNDKPVDLANYAKGNVARFTLE